LIDKYIMVSLAHVMERATGLIYSLLDVASSKVGLEELLI